MEQLRRFLKKRKTFLLILSISLFIFFLLILITPDPILSKPADFSKVILDENGKILRVYLNSKEQWFIPLSEQFDIPEKLEKAVLSYEDKWFYYHPGWDPVAILRAIYQNIRQRRIVSGGSTITMQLVRVSYNKKRTFFNKMLELFLTLKLEMKYSKKEILRLYLERAPYGRNIVGIQAASLKYFQKEPKELSWSEAATLAILPNAPGIISPGKNQQKLVTKKNRLLQAMYERNIISKIELQLALHEPVPEKVISFPFLAPHFTDFVKHKTEKSVVHTTINSQLQSDLQKLFELYGKELQEVGIQNCAGIVVETKTGKIKAWIGSQDFFDFKRLGQVDGVTASRSTGSILKPFLYASAINEGYILPQTLIQDVPTYFKHFSPENASFSYKGLVTAKKALTLSLNIPAVRLLNLSGVYQFYSFLKSAGVSSLFRSADDYGLTLIIGGAEISLLDLAGLYVGLANYGSFREIQCLESRNHINEKQLLSKGASYLTLEMLNDLQRPETYMYWQLFDGKQNIAWKTGTSFGHRDAWAAGVTPEWTVCIWAGNFTGDSNPEIKGANAAGSLMFRVFQINSQSNSWFKVPEKEMRKQAICRISGHPAGDFCTEIDTVLVPQNAKIMKKCPYHKKIFINAEETHQVCSLCWDSQTKKEKIILVYPPSANEMLKKQGYSIAQLPPHNSNCPQFSSNSQIEIRYPIADTKIFIPRDFSGNYQKVVFELSHSKFDIEVFWYLDEKYLGSTIGIHHLSATIDSGVHELYVIDENGDSDKVVFEVSKN